MSKFYLFLLICVSLFIFSPSKTIAQETTCPIDSDAGEVACSDGVCLSVQYDCVDNHPCYNDFYKNDFTACQLYPNTPRFRCDNTQSCISLNPPACNPNDSSCTGTCSVQRLPSRPVTYSFTNNCLPDYKTNFIPGTTPRCECIPKSAEACSLPSSCANNTDCSSAPNCGSKYVCLGAIQGRTPGRCVDGTNICIKATQTCSTDSDCSGGGAGCSNYTCWELGRDSSQCRFGIQPPPVPTPSPNLISGGGVQCGTDTDPAISTAIGCIHTSPIAFVTDLLKFITAFAGGLAFLLMLVGAFQMITSAGNPDTLHAGRDRFTSAIIGLLFVIFSVLLMKIIGVDILGFNTFLGY